MQRKELRKGSREEWVFNLLSLRSNPDTNIVNYTPEMSGNADKFNKGYAVLKQMGYIIKLFNGSYLINPQILPVFEPHRAKVFSHWLEVTGKKH